MLKIEIKDTTIESRNITVKNGPRAGQQMQLRTQTGWAYTVAPDGSLHPYPERIEINIEDGCGAYPPGVYLVDPSCLYVDRFNRLTLGRLKLRPLADKSAALKVA